MISIRIMKSEREPDLWRCKIDATCSLLDVHSEPGKEPSFEQVETQLRELLAIFGVHVRFVFEQQTKFVQGYVEVEYSDG